MFCIDSMVCGYHNYQSIWHHPLVDGELVCEQEAVNSHDPQAVAIKKMINGNHYVVGHVPKRISSICLIFKKEVVPSFVELQSMDVFRSICLKVDKSFFSCALTFSTANTNE